MVCAVVLITLQAINVKKLLLLHFPAIPRARLAFFHLKDITALRLMHVQLKNLTVVIMTIFGVQLHLAMLQITNGENVQVV